MSFWPVTLGHQCSQILINLLTNAIKFTEEGEVKLITWNDGEHLHFKVEDTGIGMSQETLERVFKQYEQADGLDSHRYGGTGLGLYISLNLAQMMDGSLEAESREGVGSTFLLVIPYRQTNTPATTEEDPSEHPRFTSPVRFSGKILVAEDTKELQILEKRVLEGLGLTVAIAKDGVEAVSMAQDCSYDLILMDMQMPRKDGIAATRELRERQCATPIVALTANVMQKHKHAFHEAGIDGFLGKPIDKRELTRVLGHFLLPDAQEGQQQRVRLRRKEDRGLPAGQHIGVERRFRDRRKPAVSQPAVCEEVDSELMEVFRESNSESRQLLEMALRTEDWSRIKELAHPIKGSGTSFGFPHLTEKAKTVCDAYDTEQYGQLPALTKALIDELGQALNL